MHVAGRHLIALVVFRPYASFRIVGYVIVDVLTVVASVFAAYGTYDTENTVSMVAVCVIVFVVIIDKISTVLVFCKSTFLFAETSGDEKQTEVTEMATKPDAPLHEPLWVDI